MKNKIIYLAILAFLCHFHIYAQEVILIGVYQGNNLYVQNKFLETKNEFCIKEIHINNKKVSDKIKSSAVEINLSHLKIGDSVEIKIHYEKGCSPKIINPEVILATKESFEFINLSVSADAIQWSAQGESSKGIFSIEYYDGTNWIEKGKLTIASNHIYSYSISHQLGINRYRIKYILSNENVISEELTYETKKIPVTFSSNSLTETISLSQEASYEIANLNGIRVKKGKGSEIDISSLAPGDYYLIINAKAERFTKK
jgi:hypothetical protein